MVGFGSCAQSCTCIRIITQHESFKYTVLIKNTLPCQTRAVRGYPRVLASTRTEFLPLVHNTHSRGVKWRSRGRRVKREPSVKSSVLSNESYFKRNLVMANQLYSCQKERIASLSEKGKNIYQIVTILESEGSKNLAHHC